MSYVHVEMKCLPGVSWARCVDVHWECLWVSGPSLSGVYVSLCVLIMTCMYVYACLWAEPHIGYLSHRMGTWSQFIEILKLTVCVYVCMCDLYVCLGLPNCPYDLKYFLQSPSPEAPLAELNKLRRTLVCEMDRLCFSHTWVRLCHTEVGNTFT